MTTDGVVIGGRRRARVEQSIFQTLMIALSVGSGASAECSTVGVSFGDSMTKPLQRDAIYLKRHFDAEIIVLCVRWYITYKLSYRDLAAMMAERAVVVSHTTIMRWVIHYARVREALE
jgi:hypothetical protein